MTIAFETLAAAPRILIQARLRPVAGSRIQPTGFPDLGAAVYTTPDGTEMLLVESAQSMANRLEAACWDEAADDLVPDLAGLPYVKVNLRGLGPEAATTSSLQEFHRLNSPYLMAGRTVDGRAFADVLRSELGLATVPGGKKGKKPPKDDAEADGEKADDVVGVVNLRRLAAVVFKYDPNALVHGVFLEKIAGRLRHPRALSSFIEAEGAVRADSGGVKFDRVLPRPKAAGLDAAGGYGNVPFHRSEFTAKSITAYFSLDLAQVRGYGLGDDATKLLVALALWKVRAFLDSSMRLRSACELEIDDGDDGGLVVKRPPSGFDLPPAGELASVVGELIGRCRRQFADPPVTELTWTNPRAKGGES